MRRYVSVSRKSERVCGALLQASRDAYITIAATGYTCEAKNSRKHVREYNSAMAFASMGKGKVVPVLN
jgi:hypothetical protein